MVSQQSFVLHTNGHAHMQDITNGSTNCSSFADCDKLIKNGTLNTDGTYNQSTAARLGWTVPQPETVSTAPPARPAPPCPSRRSGCSWSVT